MPNELLPVAPSTAPEIAALQLKHALEDLATSEETKDPRAYRPYLLQLLAHAFEALAGGRPREMQEDCELIEGVRSILEDHVPPDLNPRVEAAMEIFSAIRTLQTGIRALAAKTVCQRRLKPHEEPIVRILADAKTYLQRKEVHLRLPEKIDLTAPRVGQILSELYHDGFLLRYQAPVQGGMTSFYALSQQGEAALNKYPKVRNIVDGPPRERLTKAVASRPTGTGG